MIMESSSWPENLPSNRIKAIKELTQGKVLINRLQKMRDQPQMIESSLKLLDDTTAQILRMFENTISILNSNSTNSDKIPDHDTSFPNNLDDQKVEDSIESVKTLAPIKTKRGCYKRRKNSPIFTKVSANLIDDGYAWRKYGQKVILNSTHQRCTHKFEQGCQATKQVQKTDEEPSKYRVTYHGHHTCKNLQKSHEIILDSPNSKGNSVILSFDTNTINNRQQAGALPSSTKLKSEDGFRSLSTKCDKASSSDHDTTWNQVTPSSQVPLEYKWMMSFGLDHEDVVSSGVFSSTCSKNGYEIDDIFE
ncbi:hypothetical protein E3N88_22156 [Mikania micrantha]|uniref:WRKY domain-containing protein n=1 Tax=Mikania micrantha TaxID=192012 RepID=A0A5N6NC70_9ASTR|nr:hypothetical protein E3N88_22156 [Mikania micrantha]